MNPFSSLLKLPLFLLALLLLVPCPGRAQNAAKSTAAPLVLRAGAGKAVADLKVSRDGKTAVVTTNEKIEVYDVGARKLVRAFEGGMGAFELALSPDAGTQNGRVAASTTDFWVSVNDLADGKQQAHFFLLAVGGATGLSWSPDGQMIATASSNQVALFAPDGNILARHEDKIGVGPDAIAFSPDGTQLVSGWSDRALRIYDTANFDKPQFEYQKPQLREVGRLEGQTGALTALSWSKDGHFLASGDTGGSVVIWDYAARKSLASWIVGDAAVTDLAWAPSGKTVAVATKTLQGGAAVTLWDVATGKAKLVWKHPLAANRLAFVGDGQTLLVADMDGALTLVPVGAFEWFKAVVPTPVDLNQAYLKLPGSQEIADLAWSHDGRLLASVGQTQLTVRDLKSGELVRVPQTHTQSLQGVSFSPDDSLLATSSYGGVEVADVKAQKILWQHPERGVIAGWSNDGTTLYIAEGSQQTAQIVALDARTGKPIQVIGQLSGTFYNSPIVARLSPDKTRIAVAIFDKDNGRLNKCALQVFDIAGARRLWSEPLNGRCSALAWSGDGRWIVAKAGDRADGYPNGYDYVAGQMGVKWFDAATGKLDETRTRLDLRDAVAALAFAPDGQTLVVALERGAPQLWDANGKPKTELAPATSNLVTLAFSDDGQHLAAAGQGAPLQFWSPPPGF